MYYYIYDTILRKKGIDIFAGWQDTCWKHSKRRFGFVFVHCKQVSKPNILLFNKTYFKQGGFRGAFAGCVYKSIQVFVSV